jgi:tRNA (guanine37-N1)-methyltransferase
MELHKLWYIISEIYSTNKQKQVDDYAFGGGAGMVMAIEPIDRLITELKKERKYDEIIFLTPRW